MSCTKAQEFLERKKIQPKVTSDARKQSMGKDAALKLASEVDEIVAAKGSKIVHLDMKHESPDDDEVLSVLLGPTGNLRAPTIRQGRKLLVGFNEEAYKQFFR